MVLIDNCTTAVVLPVICDFDVHLYGEGYGFASLENYWDFFGSIKNMYAQGCIWPGDTEGSRCAATVAYNYDLLTGGGQYCYIDWRLYPKKFPYARGVTSEEPLFVKAYNLAQYYFGMYESTPHYFATSADLFSTTTPLTYVTIYHNRVWGDYLIPITNMSSTAVKTTLVMHSLEELDIDSNAEYVLYDVNERSSQVVKGEVLKKGLGPVQIPERTLKLFYLRQVSKEAPYHLWGGKRISEVWNEENQKLILKLHGPSGLQDKLLIAGGTRGFERVTVDGQPASFFYDRSRGIAHGSVTFAAEPITVVAISSENSRTNLPPEAVPPDQLTTQYLQEK